MSASDDSAAPDATTNVYVAADFGRIADARDVAAVCSRARGIRVTSRWHDDAGGDEVNAARAGRSPDSSTASQAAERNVADIHDSDVMVVLTTGATGRGGRQFETGLAYALGKRVILIGEDLSSSHFVHELTSKLIDVAWVTHEGTASYIELCMCVMNDIDVQRHLMSFPADYVAAVTPLIDAIGMPDGAAASYQWFIAIILAKLAMNGPIIDELGTRNR